MKNILFFLFIINFQILFCQGKAEYTVCIDFPERKDDTSCYSKTSISFFQVNQFLQNLDLSKVNLYLTVDSFKKKKREQILPDFHKLNYLIDTISRINIETGMAEHVVVICSRDFLANGIKFNETLSFDSFLTKKINHYVINQKNDIHDSSTVEIYLQNNLEFDKMNIDKMIDIEYEVDRKSFDSNFFNDYFSNPTFLFKSNKFKIQFDDYIKYELIFKNMLTDKKLPFNQLKGKGIKETVITGVRFKEKWIWDENGIFHKKVIAFCPIFYRVFEDNSTETYYRFWFIKK